MPYSGAADKPKRGESRIRNAEIRKKMPVSKESKVVMPKGDEAPQIMVKEARLCLPKDEATIERQRMLP